MSELPVEAGGPGRPPGSAVERMTSWVATAGGLLALSIATLATLNVLGRWLLNAPIDGDVELVQIGTAIGVFAYLPYTQARRGNIMVDTFTGWLAPRARSLVDAFWDLVFAAFMAFCAVGLFTGAGEAFRNGQATPQLQILVWPMIGLCAALCTLLAITAILTAARLAGGRA